MKAILFGHWTELFTLVHLTGYTHCSWWWLLFFFAHDGITGIAAIELIKLQKGVPDAAV